jgi:hypothetical protein
VGISQCPTVFALADFDSALRIGHSARAMAFSLALIKRDPRFLWFWRTISPLVAVFMYLDAKLTLLTSTVTLQGAGATYAGPGIYVNWHKYVPFLCIHYGQRRFWLLMSSAPYLEPVAMWCRWMELTVIRSSPGERSRESLGRLIAALKTGNSVAAGGRRSGGSGVSGEIRLHRSGPRCRSADHSRGLPISQRQVEPGSLGPVVRRRQVGPDPSHLRIPHFYKSVRA